MESLPSDQIFLSIFEGCETKTPIGEASLERILEVIRNGEHGLKALTTQIQNNYGFEYDIGLANGSAEEARRKAHKAVSALKAGLWAVTFSGTFSERNIGSLVTHSGILCADLDNMTEGELALHQKSWPDYPQVRAFYRSPTGTGLKVLFNIMPDASRHDDSFRAVQKFVRDETGKEIDKACRDVCRLSFLAYCPDSFLRTTPWT